MLTGERGRDDKSKQEYEDKEDPSKLQLTWEMLELAKVVFAKTTASRIANLKAKTRQA